MYHMRWDIETAFKSLKYIIRMVSFHSKKRNFIQQEIYAAILLHCLTNIITERIEINQSDKWKHYYKTNLSTAVTNIRLWLKKIISSAELIKRVKKYLAPVSPDRKYQRNMRPKSVVPFNTKASQRHIDYISYISNRQFYQTYKLAFSSCQKFNIFNFIV